AEYLRHIARYGPEDSGDDALNRMKELSTESPRALAMYFRAIYQGLQERGARPAAATLDWAEELGRTLLASETYDDIRDGIELAAVLKRPVLAGRLVEL